MSLFEPIMIKYLNLVTLPTLSLQRAVDFMFEVLADEG
jgi:hypothetical protein